MTVGRRRRGRLIAVEGIDGSGKSTFVPALGHALRRRGWSVALRREPSDRALGALAQSASVRDPWTGGVYFTLDRWIARRSLEADLDAHDVVVSDRSFYSTLAYQGSALDRSTAARLARLQANATVPPDRVVLLEIPPAAALRRLGGRSVQRTPLERGVTLRRVAGAYRKLARSPRWIVADARLPPPAIVEQVLARVERWLGRPPPRVHRRRARRRT